VPSPRHRAFRPPDRPLVLGHRGASAAAPENTIAAFRRAREEGADGVELDVRRCRTGEVVVFHDADARRIAASPLRIAEAALSDLRALDAGAHRGEQFRGERIPLLAEALEALPGAFVNVELKSQGRDLRLAGATARVIRALGAGDRVIVSSFDYRLLIAFRVAAPELPIGLLFERNQRWRLWTGLAIRLLRPAAVHPDRALVTEARARRWTDRGLGMNVWTVDDPEEARRLAALGATALITNSPARIVEALNHHSKPNLNALVSEDSTS
jgi:glycerophosphoryl diester phosphodiesterase